MMSDIVDQAQDAEALFIALARQAVTLDAPVLRATGQCYNCQAPLDPGLRFCDPDCRDDYGIRRTSEVRLGMARR
jgi:hypothetical protein